MVAGRCGSQRNRCDALESRACSGNFASTESRDRRFRRRSSKPCNESPARPAGIEPATPGLEGLDDSSYSVSDGGKSAEIQPVAKDDLSHKSPGNAPDSRSFGAIVVQAERAGGSGSAIGPYLTVREVAARLHVCTATVYSLCESGGLAHARLNNAIRIGEADLRRYLEKVSR
jgi:excisionase family DNA binding protein